MAKQEEKFTEAKKEFEEVLLSVDKVTRVTA